MVARNDEATCVTRGLGLLIASITGTAYVLAQALPVSEIGLLPGDAAIAPATNSQQEHSIARGGDQYLIAWSDFRARSSGSQTIQSDGDIFGIRIDASGAPIDAMPFMIAGGMGLQRYPKVSWNGENWLVVYQSQDPVGSYFDTQIRAVRVSPLGEVLDAPPILLPPTQFSPSTIGLNVAGQAGQWLVTRCVYHDTGYGTFLAGQRISERPTARPDADHADRLGVRDDAHGGVGMTRLGDFAQLGDINGDGDVDQSDLGVLLATYGLCAGDPGFDLAADLDGDGCVGQGDLGELLAHYGM
jgi:hypothetical protein